MGNAGGKGVLPNPQLLLDPRAILRWASPLQAALLRLQLVLSSLTDGTGVLVPVVHRGRMVWLGSGWA